MRRLACAALAALLFFPVAAAAAPKPIPPGHARPGRFQVIKTYTDGPWLVPTLHGLRSRDAWDLQMARWLADGQVAGREEAPQINWNQQAVVVVSLGSQMGQCGMDVKHCSVFADTTLFDLHFVTPTQWDPNGSIEHPAMLIAVDRSDLKNLKILFDTTIDGLPGGASRRGNGVGMGMTSEWTTPLPSEDAVNASFEANTTWGRLKDDYRR